MPQKAVAQLANDLLQIRVHFVAKGSSICRFEMPIGLNVLIKKPKIYVFGFLGVFILLL